MRFLIFMLILAHSVVATGWQATVKGQASVQGQGSLKLVSTGPPPDAPTGLTATAINWNQINLNWTGAVGALHYNVLRSTTSGGPYTLVANSISATNYSNF